MSWYSQKCFPKTHKTCYFYLKNTLKLCFIDLEHLRGSSNNEQIDKYHDILSHFSGV